MTPDTSEIKTTQPSSPEADIASTEEVQQDRLQPKEPSAVKRPGIRDASLFFNRALALPFKSLPARLEKQIRNTIQAWSGTEEESDLKQQVNQVSANFRHVDDQQFFGGDLDEKSIRVLTSIARNPPLQYPLEVTYTQEDLEARFPQGAQLQKYLGQDIQINMYAHVSTNTSGLMYTVETENDKYAFRIMKSDRPFTQIQHDIQNAPEILSPLQVFQFSDGSIGILSKWVEGKPPETPEDKQLCREKANELIIIPWEIDHPNTPYDFNYTNFVITKDSTVHYIDGDLAEIIVKYGISENIPEKRRELLERGKEKL